MLLLLCVGLFSWLLLKFMNDDAQRRLEHRQATEKGCQVEQPIPEPALPKPVQCCEPTVAIEPEHIKPTVLPEPAHPEEIPPNEPVKECCNDPTGILEPVLEKFPELVQSVCPEKEKKQETSVTPIVVVEPTPDQQPILPVEESQPTVTPTIVPEPETCHHTPLPQEESKLEFQKPESYCPYHTERSPVVPVPRERTTHPQNWSTCSGSDSDCSLSSAPAQQEFKKVLEELREKHREKPEVLEILHLTREVQSSVSSTSSSSSASSEDSDSDSDDEHMMYSFRNSSVHKSQESTLRSESSCCSDELTSYESESDEDVVIEFRRAEILKRAPELDQNNNVPQNKKPVDPIFVAPPPPRQEMEKLPFICRLNKETSADEYGFNLHAEKNRGHFIGAVDHGGIGDKAGLKMGQRIVGVNDVLIQPSTPYKEVVTIIKKSPMSTTLLVASEDTDKWYKANNQSYSWDHAIEGAATTNGHIEEEIIQEHEALSPHSIQIDEEIHVHESPLPPKYDVPPPIEDDHRASNLVSAQYDLPPIDTTTPVIDSANLLDAVFGGLPVETLEMAPQLEEYNHHHHEEVPEPVEQKELIDHSGHDHHEVETPIVDDRHVPAYNPYSDYQVSQASPVSNGSSSQSSHGSLSPGSGRDDYGIYGLSAKQARERLRQSKPRAAEMSLEEKYRLVSNM